VRTSNTFGRYSSARRTGCASERTSGSVRGAPGNRCPYRDQQLWLLANTSHQDVTNFTDMVLSNRGYWCSFEEGPMKQLSRPRRAPSKLSDSIHRQLNLYGLAASAAGVGILALAKPAEAKIVYTPANKPILNCVDHPRLCFILDVNHDNIVDFRIPLIATSYNFHLGIVPATKRTKNRIWGTASHPSRYAPTFSVASALSSGVTVGPSFPGKFEPGNTALAAYNSACGDDGCAWGQWWNKQNKYVGLKFYAKGRAHYGWARLSVGWRASPVTLTGYAYETIPNKPIITGKTKGPDVITIQPATLGHLAQGASAVSSWQATQTGATTH